MKEPEQLALFPAPLVTIDATADSAVTHDCGAVVPLKFEAGGVQWCPKCLEAL